MPGGFLCRDRLPRTVRIYESANSNYSSLRGKNLARSGAYSFALLRHGSPGTSSRDRRIHKRASRTAYCSALVFHFIVVCDSRQLARGCCDGDPSRVEGANYESSVGKYCSTRRHSISLSDEFRAFVDHPEDSMAKCAL